MTRKIIVAFVLVGYTVAMWTISGLHAKESVYEYGTTYQVEQKVLVHEVSIKLLPLKGVEMDIPPGWFMVSSHTVTFNDRLLVVMIIEKAMTNSQRKTAAAGAR